MKAAIVTITKHEENYINEWLNWHLALGFDHIFIGDNNEKDYQFQLKDAIHKNIDLNKISIYDYREYQPAQLQFYWNLYAKEKYNYDWFLFIDIDEYLQLKKHNNIKDYLSEKIFENFNAIIVPWILYDDNDLVTFEDKPLHERFTHIAAKQCNETKYFVRGNLDVSLSIHIPHSKKDQIIYCSENGLENPINTYLGSDGLKRYQYKYFSNNYELADIQHYRFKTIQEYIQKKVVSGDAIQKEKNYWLTAKSDSQLLDTFFRFNKKTKEKEEFGKQLLLKIRQTIPIG